MNMKAYIVTDGDGEDGGTVIVFATNGAAARRLGGNEIGCDWEGVESCTRKPEYDQYAEAGKVPDLVLIADGWWFECHHCGQKVSNNLKEEVWDAGLNPDDFEAIEEQGRVYCSHGCRVMDYANRINRGRAVAAMVEYVTTKWPGVHVEFAHVYKSHLEPTEQSGGIKCSAQFRFPGGKHFVQWIFPRDEVLVAQYDVPAWNAFTARQNQLNQGV